MKRVVAGVAAAAFFLGVIAATAVTTVQGSPKYQLDVQAQNDDGDCATIDGPCSEDPQPCKLEIEVTPALFCCDKVNNPTCKDMDLLSGTNYVNCPVDDIYIEVHKETEPLISDSRYTKMLARGHTDKDGKVTLEYAREEDGTCEPRVAIGMYEYNSQNGKYAYEPYVYPPDVTKPVVFKDYAGERTGMINIGGALMAGQVPPFEPEDSYCPVGQTCDVACAKGYAGFDAAMNCKNANVGYCCK